MTSHCYTLLCTVSGSVGDVSVGNSQTTPQRPAQPLSRPSLLARTSSLPETSSPSSSLTVELPPVRGGAPPVPPRVQRSTSVGGGAAGLSSLSSRLSHARGEVAAVSEVSEADENLANECTVCFERACDSVIYTCGHMCMCYSCAISVKSSSDPLCPICRQVIKDVIRIYKS